jgi:hypothetical protein
MQSAKLREGVVIWIFAAAGKETHNLASKDRKECG